MHDDVVLSVNGKKIAGIKSYSVDSDLFLAAGQFSFECSGEASFIDPGMPLKLYINGVCEMSGIIDGMDQMPSKKNKSVIIYGRDMMGLLCDHFCQNFGTVDKLNGKTLQQIAEMLIRQVPFIKKEDIEYQEKTARLDKLYNLGKISPGETVFETLKRCSTGRGLLFYCMPGGTFVFGKPREKVPAAPYHLVRSKKNPLENNIIDGGLRRNISRCYSKVTVLGQVQGESEWGTPEQITISADAIMPGNIVPFFKPMVMVSNKDVNAPSREAAFEIGKQRARAFELEYIVPYHHQPSGNWKINELCTVFDDEISVGNAGIRDTFLIYGRTFERDNKNGTITRLRLGYPGIIIND